MGIGSGSYCLADGVKVEYRNQDGDNGSNRPKYQISQNNVNLNKEVLYVLYNKSDKAIGWIKTSLTNGKYLPEQK